MRNTLILCLPFTLLFASAAGALPLAIAGPDSKTSFELIVRKTCKQVDSCEEAVEIWCEGYRRADADNDGIPCENICHSLEQVEEIRKSKC